MRLALGGAVGKTTKTRADETTIKAEDDEKKVESLYAVLFKDAEVSTEDGEDAADLFFKAINVTDSIYHDNDSVRFKVSSGDYQICFVANPSTGLFDGLTAGSSKVSDFKALVETKAPDTKPGMLMTSDFHKATVTTNDSTLLTKTVELERAMARIDIVNKADGITIDSVKLVNRAMESVLINDSGKNALALTDTTYKDVSLAGKADGTATYKANIYSYEQYGEGDYAPSMVVYYSIGEKKYTHTIKFVTKGENDAETQINLKRNYLYTVNITNNAGKLTFTLTVADWNKGTTFVVSSEELAEQLDKISYDNTNIGDYITIDDEEGLVWYKGDNTIKVISLDETSAKWSDNTTTTNATSTTDGKSNTVVIINVLGTGNAPAAAWCKAKGENWYLPAKDELESIMESISTLNNYLNQTDGRTKTALGITGSEEYCSYWSSTEQSTAGYAIRYLISSTAAQKIFGETKSTSYRVRAVGIYTVE